MKSRARGLLTGSAEILGCSHAALSRDAQFKSNDPLVLSLLVCHHRFVSLRGVDRSLAFVSRDERDHRHRPSSQYLVQRLSSAGLGNVPPLPYAFLCIQLLGFDRWKRIFSHFSPFLAGEWDRLWDMCRISLLSLCFKPTLGKQTNSRSAMTLNGETGMEILAVNFRLFLDENVHSWPWLRNTVREK